MNTSIANPYKPSVFPIIAVALVILTLGTMMFIRIGVTPFLWTHGGWGIVGYEHVGLRTG